MNKIRLINSIISRFFFPFSILFLTGCLPDGEIVFEDVEFLDALSDNGVEYRPLPIESHPISVKIGKTALSKQCFQVGESPFLLYCFNSKNECAKFGVDSNSSFHIYRNENLALVVKKNDQGPYIKIFDSMQAGLSYKQAGVFIYPLAVCLFLVVFIITERTYSLRRGLTFPRKVEKALRSGEFPNKKWKRRSAAERITYVAVHEKPSRETLAAYSRLEIAALEKGLFLLEVVVSGAPLVGLLGTATGLVQVFSNMPAGGPPGGNEIFSEGIALALLTTIIGLGIAIPALIGHAYLTRIVEKRSASLDWLTARLVDAITKSNHSKVV